MQHLKELIKFSKCIHFKKNLLNIKLFMTLPIKIVENFTGDDITYIISI